MRYVHEKVVKSCYNSCKFFKTDGYVMLCFHPELENLDLEKQLIITQENSRGRVPDECPLRKGCVEVVLKISLDEEIKK